MPGPIGEIAREPSDTVGHESRVEQGEGRHVRPYGFIETGPGADVTTEVASPSAARITRAILGSGRRVSAYASPIRSYKTFSINAA